MKKGNEIAMYSDKFKHPASRRANDEFLRRMMGGELCASNELAVMSTGTAGDGAPSCNQESAGECPREIAAPAIAMVYAPRQCWRSILDNRTALKSGTLFAELVLPLEATKQNRNGGQNPQARGEVR